LVRIRASSLNFHDDMVVPEAPGSHLKRLLRKWHGPFQARLTPSVIPSEVEESLILTITSSKRCLDCARHDKKPIWATRPQHLTLNEQAGATTLPFKHKILTKY